MKEIFERQRQKEANLNWKYPWFNVAYNYAIAATCITLAVSLIIWGLDVRTDRRAAEMTAAAMANYQAEVKAAEDARAQELAAAQADEENVIQQEAREVAKAFYGIRRFCDRYGYDDSDLATYARCMFNRADAKKTPLKSVISREGQFLGYSEDNLVLDVYLQPALAAVREWHSEDVKPCGLDYQYAELTERGIYLVNEFGADGYVRRWHA